MALPLAEVQEIIERSVFETIRVVLVAEGYLPDITTYLPQSQINYDAYNTAIVAVKTAKGFCIEVFGSGSNQSKYQKKVPRIVIQTRRFLAGEIGTPPEGFYQLQEDNTFRQVKTAPTTSVMQIDIRLVSNSQEQDRIMHAVIGKALTTRKYIQRYDIAENVDPNAKFFIAQLSYNDYGEMDEGVMERAYTYQVPDIYQTEWDTLSGPIAPITEITVTPTFEGPPTDTTDDPIVVT